jgi:hypothetical protein
MAKSWMDGPDALEGGSAGAPTEPVEGEGYG